MARHIDKWAYGCYAWSVFVLFLLVGGGLVLLSQNPARGRRVAHVCARMLFRLAGMRISARGIDRLPASSHILLVNHASFLDVLALMALLPPSPGYAFTTRQQFPSQRLLCPLVQAMGTLVLRTPRTGNTRLIAATLSRGERLVIFPEGGFVRPPGLRPFHSGAFFAAARSHVPIAVAGLRGAREALPLGTWLPHRTAISLEIGPVFMPRGTDEDAILELSRAARETMLPLSGEFETQV